MNANERRFFNAEAGGSLVVKGPKRAAGCDQVFAAKTTNEYGQESMRVTWCCRLRNGIFLQDWKCVGVNSPKCPKHNAGAGRTEVRGSAKSLVETKETP